jgi:hypothetical protein
MGFSPGSPSSSTTKAGRHNIAQILLKVALNTKNQIKSNQNKRYSQQYVVSVTVTVSTKVLYRPISLWYPLFQGQWDRCDQRNHKT